VRRHHANVNQVLKIYVVATATSNQQRQGWKVRISSRFEVVILISSQRTC
jgi:hypothetical protein